ncbi:MAG: hypothetical protein ACOY3P_20105 [Planctomycetota bacterium]
MPSAVIRTSTINRYLKSKTETVYRKSAFMAGLKGHGCQVFGAAKNAGLKLVWRPRIRRRKITAINPYRVRHSFAAFNERIEAELEWRAYGLGEKIQKITRLLNGANETRTSNVVQEVMDNIMDDFTDDFGTKLYNNGHLNDGIHGLETPCAVTSTISNSVLGDPSGTYAGHSTALGDMGGDWTGDFPSGHGDHEYYAWSPFVYDYQNTGWSATTKTWTNTWLEVLLHSFAYVGRLHNRKPEFAIFDTDLVVEAKNHVLGSDRFQVTVNSPVVEAGFSTVKFDGVELIDEYAVPSGCGYASYWKEIELRSLQNQLVGFMEDKEIRTSEDLMACDYYGNMRLTSPAFLIKYAAISDLST